MTTPQAKNSREWLRHEAPLLASAMVIDRGMGELCNAPVFIWTHVCPYSGDLCLWWMTTLGFNPSAGQHAKV
jgi:hypothetical protein